MDKIILSENEMFKIFEWKDQHKDLVRSSVCPLKAIEINIENNIRFKAIREANNLTFHVFSNGNKCGRFKAKILKNNLGYIVTENKQKLDEEFILSASTLYFSIMAIMAYGNKHEKETPEQKKECSVTSTENKQKRKRYANNYTYIIRDALSNSSNDSMMKREYHSKGLVFGVRGHYRHYKSGRTVWINEYKKGSGTKRNKKYKLGEI